MSTPSTDPRAHAVPVTPREVIASYTEYADAQAAVDTLSDKEFPVASTQIVGHDVRTVETVTGRVTNGSAAVRGAAGGAWFGLMLGLLFGIFTPGVAWLGVLLVAVGIGALWGALFGFVGHYATRGKRDFRLDPDADGRPLRRAGRQRAGRRGLAHPVRHDGRAARLTRRSMTTRTDGPAARPRRHVRGASSGASSVSHSSSTR